MFTLTCPTAGFAEHLRNQSIQQIMAWLADHPDLRMGTNVIEEATNRFHSGLDFYIDHLGTIKDRMPA